MIYKPPPWYTKELNDLVAQMDERTRQEVLKIFRTVAARNHRTPTITQELYELIFRGLQAKYPGQPIGLRFQAVCAALDGGKGSGNFGHEGRPGKVSGSGEGGGKKAVSKKDEQNLNAQEAEELYKSDWIKAI